MKTYRMTIAGGYDGFPPDVSAEAVTLLEASDVPVEVVRAVPGRRRGTDVVVVNLTFRADRDETACEARDLLRRGMSWADVSNLRSGRGKSYRYLH